MTAHACSTVLIYFRGDLLSLCRPLTISLSSRIVIQQLGLVVRRRRSQYSRARGRRGGRLLQRRIPTISIRDRSKQINTLIALQASVANIPSPLICICKTDEPAPVKVGCSMLERSASNTRISATGLPLTNSRFVLRRDVA